VVEMPCTSLTSEDTRNKTLHLLRNIGRDPVPTKDSPGHVQGRMEAARWLKDLSAVGEGRATAWEVDAMQIYGHNNPRGPLENIDDEGLDRVLDAMQYLYDELGRFYFRPPQILKQKVREGKLGKKTGEGFHKYDAEGKRIDAQPQ
jgi:3-hydroxybutyryl-CoA dehydrogenase